jgi:spore coat polysaccharide biosynthesis protein SpsF
MEAIVEQFGDEPVSIRALADFLAGRPDLIELNAHVLQKALVQA